MPRVTTLIGGEQYISVPEAARRKGVSRQAIWDACRVGRLDARRIGRFWFVRVETLRRWHPQPKNGAHGHAGSLAAAAK